MPRHADKRALVTGGTSGIGEAIVTRLARGGRARRLHGSRRGARRTASQRPRARASCAPTRARRQPSRPRSTRPWSGSAASTSSSSTRACCARRCSRRRRTSSGTPSSRRTSSRPFRYARAVLPALRATQGSHGARRVRRRRVGRDADRRVLGLEALADHAHAHARRRGRARRRPRERGLSRRHRARHGDDRRRTRGAARHRRLDAPAARAGSCRQRDVAAAVSFLASDEARTITGVDLLVDGGMRAALRANTVAAGRA